jgi:amino acid permease
VTMSMIIISPTCFLSRLDSLSYTSTFALSGVVYLIFVVAVFYISPPDGMISHPP